MYHAWPLRAASRAYGRIGGRNEAEPPADAGSLEQRRQLKMAVQNPFRAGRHGGRTYLISSLKDRFGYYHWHMTWC